MAIFGDIKARIYEKATKKCAPTPIYVSPAQLSLECFKAPFEQHLNFQNCWVILAKLIPWDEICNLYLKHVGVSDTGRPPLNPRIVIGSLIIKHKCNLDDRETVDQISENLYMQYLLGYSSFTSEAPFDVSLFVELRKRLGMDALNAINEKIASLKTHMETKEKEKIAETNPEIPSIQNGNGTVPLMGPQPEVDEKPTAQIADLGPLPEQEIEASFRILKTDLEICPVFHKTDENTMAHLFLAVLAYQLVSTIRYRLKAKGIHHDWSHIVRIMNLQKAATVTMQDKNDRKIYIRKCNKPETKAREIYDALGYKYQPWIRKSVLPEKQFRKTDNSDCLEITS